LLLRSEDGIYEVAKLVVLSFGMKNGAGRSRLTAYDYNDLEIDLTKDRKDQDLSSALNYNILESIYANLANNGTAVVDVRGYFDLEKRCSVVYLGLNRDKTFLVEPFYFKCDLREAEERCRSKGMAFNFLRLHVDVTSLNGDLVSVILIEDQTLGELVRLLHTEMVNDNELRQRIVKAFEDGGLYRIAENFELKHESFILS
jgi:hypothetical protein